MKRSWMLLVAGVLALSSCDGWTLKERGGEEEPCFTDATCGGGLTCCGDGICRSECGGGDEDGEEAECPSEATGCDEGWTTSCQGGVWVRITDCEESGRVCEQGMCEERSEGEGDGDPEGSESEEEDVPDGDAEPENDLDPDLELEPEVDLEPNAEREPDSEIEPEIEMETDTSEPDTEIAEGDLDAELDSDPDLELDPDPDPEIEEEGPGTDCTSGDCCNNGHWVAVGDPCVSGQDAFACTSDTCDAAHGCTVHTLMADKCLINTVCYDEYEAKPGFQCMWCDPTSGPTAWTDKPNTENCNDGNDCTYGELCDGNGTCSSGTPITCDDDEGICSANRSCNGTDQCTVIYPDNQTTCETDNKTCTDDKCNGAGTCDHIRQPNTCLIGGVCYAHHAVNPGNECQWCDSTANAWADKPSSESCTDEGLSCTADHCSTGSCAHDRITGKCLIEGTCYNDGAVNPSNACTYCDGYNSPTAWRNKPDDTGCGTQDQCYQGACVDCTNQTGCADLPDDHLECSEPACNSSNHQCYQDLDAHETELCGDTSESPCDHSDTCDASGVCQANREDDDTDCDDGDQCNGVSTCQSGSCNQITAPVICQDNAICSPSTGTCSCKGDFHDVTGICISDFVPIQAGTFVMGSPDGENCPPDHPDCNIADYPVEPGRVTDETQHSVTLTYDFEMSKYEVTQGEFTAFAGTNPSWFGPNGNYGYLGANWPVERVDWFEALAYANWLSTQAGLPECYELNDCTGIIGGGCAKTSGACTTGTFTCTSVILNGVSKPQDCLGYRLPTEAEWEYAARGGSTTAFYNGGIAATDCEVDTNLYAIGWYCGNSWSRAHFVGEKVANANVLGLYDMSGNLDEWVWDWFGTYPGSVNDPTGVTSGTDRILRGGNFQSLAKSCRSANRHKSLPIQRYYNIGFRLVRTLNPPTPGFTHIGAGTFIMGSPDGVHCPPDHPNCNIADYPAEPGRDQDETQHKVTLTYNFEMSTHETTQGEFSGQMGYNPGNFTGCGLDCPVEKVSWHEALKYANILSLQAGLPACFECTGIQPGFTCSLKTQYAKPQDCPGFRLPMEAEWEYAARAGTTTAFYSGGITYMGRSPLDPNLDTIAWYGGNSGASYAGGYDCSGWYSGSTTCGPQPVGEKVVNPWGLYDMSGNLLEWCWDWWDGNSDYGYIGVIDPTGQGSGSNSVVRGGSWYYNALNNRSANRLNSDPSDRFINTGFRLVRTLDFQSSCTSDYCNGHGACDAGSGMALCSCDPGFEGRTCNQCAVGAFGTYPNCFLPTASYCTTSQCFRVPPTNQTSCIDQGGNVIACPGTPGSPECGSTGFCGQDAQYADNSRVYTCYDASGVKADCASLPAAAENEVVEDSITSLMWQRTWTTNVTWQQALDYCGTTLNQGSGYAGHTDWRLPTPFELQSIVDDEMPAPTINTAAFPGTPSITFWTSQQDKSNYNYAWFLQFSIGRMWLDYKTVTYSARCVRGGYIAAGSQEVGSRYWITETVAGEPVVRDSITGLIWQKTYNATVSDWQTALAYCESLNYDSKSDWRLPNKKESMSLGNYSIYNPASDFPDMPPSYFWTSSTVTGNKVRAWAGEFYHGGVSYDDKSGTMYVRCVRGGP